MDVSVIIPTYNRLWCLPRAIQSCRNTVCNTEIIVVDDGSTDGTWEWLSAKNGIVIFKQDHLGKTWAVNKAFSVANGKYVRFLDSDDMLDTGAIDEQFKIAEKNGCDIVVGGYKNIDAADNILNENYWTECDDFIAQQLGECDSSHYSAFLFKKEFLADIPHRPDFAYRDDRMLMLESALKYPSISIYKGAPLLHRAHESNRLQFNDGLQQAVQNFQHVNIYKFILDKLKQQGNLTMRRIKASEKILWPLAHWIAKHDINEGRKIADWIFDLDPEFEIPETGPMGFLYRNLGFKTTEGLLTVRRFFKYRWQKTA